jgi:hypothetical protein
MGVRQIILVSGRSKGGSITGAGDGVDGINGQPRILEQAVNHGAVTGFNCQ